MSTNGRVLLIQVVPCKGNEKHSIAVVMTTVYSVVHRNTQRCEYLKHFRSTQVQIRGGVPPIDFCQVSSTSFNLDHLTTV